MIYSFCRAVLRVIYKALFRLEAKGMENIPQEWGVLLCANHISLLDPPTIVITSYSIHYTKLYDDGFLLVWRPGQNLSRYKTFSLPSY